MYKITLFLLVTPQLSINLLFFKIDSYIMLLLLLFIIYLKKNKFLMNKLYLYLFILLTFVMMLQTIFSETLHVVAAHTRCLECRTNDTYGYTIPSGSFNIANYLKICAMLLFSFLIFNFIKSRNQKWLLAFFLNIINTIVFVQLLFLLLHYFGILDQVIRIFFQDNIRLDGSMGGIVSIREGYLRLAGGFPEPSMLSLVYFIAIFSFYMINYNSKNKVNFRTKVHILLTWAIIFFTTISYAHLASLPIIFAIYFEVFPVFISGVFLSLFIIVELINVMDFEFIKSFGASFIARLFFVTDLSDLTFVQLIFGVEVSNFYAFIPSVNIILQMGVVGSVLFIILLYRELKSIHLIIPILFILFISPRLTDVWLYIALAFLLVVSKNMQINRKTRMYMIKTKISIRNHQSSAKY